MLNFLKKNKKSIVAPVNGKLISLTEVKDEVFASGMMGDGVAIVPKDGLYVAPVNGEVVLIPETKHAFGIKSNDGIELLVHIGLDTALKNGEGFTVLAKVGQKVTVGTPIIQVDVEYFKNENICLDTPIIILNANGYNLVKKSADRCSVADTKIFEY